MSSVNSANCIALTLSLKKEYTVSPRRRFVFVPVVMLSFSTYLQQGNSMWHSERIAKAVADILFSGMYKTEQFTETVNRHDVFSLISHNSDMHVSGSNAHASGQHCSFFTILPKMRCAPRTKLLHRL